jgi:uncharacterized protein DUF6390
MTRPAPATIRASGAPATIRASGAPATIRASGAVMFGRYAYAPNSLGYCGPPEPSALLTGSREQVEALARRFSGAWPYLQVLARMTGVADPLDHRLVESYWLGGGLGAELDPAAFTAELLAVIGPQAGHYWHHLGRELVDEAAANHCFHVFGVYPWSRLLGKGHDRQPLSVLDNCRITWGTVLSTDGPAVTVRCRRLLYDGNELSLSGHTIRRIEGGIGDRPAADAAGPGDHVALHWGRVCDRLTVEQVDALVRSTHDQLRATNRRIARQID